MQKKYTKPTLIHEQFAIEDVFTASSPVVTTDPPIGVGGVTGDGYIDYNELFGD